jgi:3' terminal RNA ribose 2'-O-methyltransferase Hen1
MRMARDLSIQRVFAMDVSFRAIEAARRSLTRLPARVAERVEITQGSLLYRDDRLRGFDAAALIEVIEHIEPDRLRWLEDSVFGYARPGTVVLTTPNVEYNVRFETLPAGQSRHHDHRFEWTRAEFRSWCERVAAEHGYRAQISPVGPVDPDVGAPSQMAVFERWT